MLVAYLKTNVIVLIAAVLIIGVILPSTRRSFAQNEISNDLGDTIRDSVNNLGKDLSNSIIGMVDKQMKSFCKGESDSSGSVQTTISKGDGSSQSVMSSQGSGSGSSQSVMSSQGSGSGSSQSVMSSQNNGEGRTIISSGGSSNGKLCGGSGDDVLRGDSGDDTIYGGAGNDIIYGEDGNDKLYGGPGDDILKGGLGADHFDCGPGKDTITDFNHSEGDTKTDDCERVVKAE
jgi:Ca2+-binding RTX toxin-like protein